MNSHSFRICKRVCTTTKYVPELRLNLVVASYESQMLILDSMDSIFMAAFQRCDASATAACNIVCVIPLRLCYALLVLWRGYPSRAIHRYFYSKYFRHVSHCWAIRLNILNDLLINLTTLFQFTWWTRADAVAARLFFWLLLPMPSLLRLLLMLECVFCCRFWSFFKNVQNTQVASQQNFGKALECCCARDGNLWIFIVYSIHIRHIISISFPSNKTVFKCGI